MTDNEVKAAFEEHKDAVYRFAWRMMHSPAAAEDVAMDTSDMSHWIPDGGRSPEAQALVKEQVNAIWTATEYLSKKQKTVFLLRFIEDMDLLEIAAATGMKEGTVKVHLFRAVRAIRERIRRLP